MSCDGGYTAAQIASALQRSKRGVLASLAASAPDGTRLVGGNPARVWRLAQLPRRMRTALADAAARQQLDSAMFLASPPSRWQPKYPINEYSEDAVIRASLLQRALAPAFVRMHEVGLRSAQFEQLGVEDYRRTFGHGVSTRHWRRLFQRTIHRDGGAENWTRLEIYLDESRALRGKTLVPVAPAALR